MSVQLGPTAGKSLPGLRSTKELRASYMTALIYAQARFGKTELIRTLVTEGFRPLIISTEPGESRGLRTISDLDIPMLEINTWDEALLVFAELKKKSSKGIVSFADREFDVVVNDSLSGFGEIWKKKGLEVMGRSEIGVAVKGWDPRRIYAYIPEKGRQTTDALMDIPCHLILICRDTMQEEEIGDGETIRYPVPELPGQKLPRELPGWLDAVVYGKIVNGQRLFLTQPEGRIIAGVRAVPSGRFDKYIKADYGKMIKAYMGDSAAFAALKITSTSSSGQSATRK